MNRLPPWLKVGLPSGPNYLRIKEISAKRKLATVCEEARCPNIAECWGGGTATFMVMGDTCTRGCRFCSVSSAAAPAPPGPQEPRKLAETLAEMKLDYAVITTVCRDDLPDQGAGHLSACLRAVKKACPSMKVEFLAQDFRGKAEPLRQVLDAGCDVLAHNLETVERLTAAVRDAKAGYEQSLHVLRTAKKLKPEVVTKSSLMVGLGEKEEEMAQAFRDLRRAGVDILTIGQYLRPTKAGRHLPVAEYLHPQQFERYGAMARAEGFLYVACGPFVRSSYRAGELFMKGLLEAKA